MRSGACGTGRIGPKTAVHKMNILCTFFGPFWRPFPTPSGDRQDLPRPDPKSPSGRLPEELSDPVLFSRCSHK
jgi:hypothetical protein